MKLNDAIHLLMGTAVEMYGDGAANFKDGVYPVRSIEIPKDFGFFRCERVYWREADRYTVNVLPGQVLRLWLK